MYRAPLHRSFFTQPVVQTMRLGGGGVTDATTSDSSKDPHGAVVSDDGYQLVLAVPKTKEGAQDAEMDNAFEQWLQWLFRNGDAKPDAAPSAESAQGTQRGGSSSGNNSRAASANQSWNECNQRIAYHFCHYKLSQQALLEPHGMRHRSYEDDLADPTRSNGTSIQQMLQDIKSFAERVAASSKTKSYRLNRDATQGTAQMTHTKEGLANVQRQLDQVIAFEGRTALDPLTAAGKSNQRKRPLKPRTQAAREHRDQVEHAKSVRAQCEKDQSNFYQTYLSQVSQMVAKEPIKLITQEIVESLDELCVQVSKLTSRAEPVTNEKLLGVVQSEALRMYFKHQASQLIHHAKMIKRKLKERDDIFITVCEESKVDPLLDTIKRAAFCQIHTRAAGEREQLERQQQEKYAREVELVQEALLKDETEAKARALAREVKRLKKQAERSREKLEAEARLKLQREEELRVKEEEAKSHRLVLEAAEQQRLENLRDKREREESELRARELQEVEQAVTMARTNSLLSDIETAKPTWQSIEFTPPVSPVIKKVVKAAASGNVVSTGAPPAEAKSSIEVSKGKPSSEAEKKKKNNTISEKIVNTARKYAANVEARMCLEAEAGAHTTDRTVPSTAPDTTNSTETTTLPQEILPRVHEERTNATTLNAAHLQSQPQAEQLIATVDAQSVAASPAMEPISLWTALCKLLSHAGCNSDQVRIDAPHAHEANGDHCVYCVFAQSLQSIDRAPTSQVVHCDQLAHAHGMDAHAHLPIDEALDQLCECICRSEFPPRACVELPGCEHGAMGPPPGVSVLFPYCYAQEAQCSLHKIFGINSLHQPDGAACVLSFKVSVAKLLQLSKDGHVDCTNWLSLGSTRSNANSKQGHHTNLTSNYLLAAAPNAFLVFMDEIGEDVMHNGLDHVLNMVQLNIDVYTMYTKWKRPSVHEPCFYSLKSVMCEVDDAYVLYLCTVNMLVRCAYSHRHRSQLLATEFSCIS